MRLDELANSNKQVTIIGGQHGDEPTGIKICQALKTLHRPGKIYVVPCVNPAGYKAKTREFGSEDMNRSYNKTVEPELEKNINLVKKLCRASDLVIDVHSTFESLLDNPGYLINQYAENYSDCFSIEQYQQEAPDGSLRWFCDQYKIPMITYEAVEINPICQKQVNLGVDEILKVLDKFGIN